MAFTPDAHSLYQRAQRLAVFRQHVPHRRRNGPAGFSPYQALRLQFAKLLDEHLVRHGRCAPLELPELVRLTAKPVKDRELPFAADGDECRIQWAVREWIRPRQARAVTSRCVLVHRVSFLYL